MTVGVGVLTTNFSSDTLIILKQSNLNYIYNYRTKISSKIIEQRCQIIKRKTRERESYIAIVVAVIGVGMGNHGCRNSKRRYRTLRYKLKERTEECREQTIRALPVFCM